jgi:tetratricopeptide (TPR) repeat protein
MHPFLAARCQTPRTCLSLSAALLLASCSVSVGAGTAVGGTGGKAGDQAALGAAQADLFANRYAQAEAAYRKYVGSHSSDPAGHSAYALFLNYSRRFSEALAEAQTAVNLRPRSAIASAVNTRVHDWSAQGLTDIQGAVTLGADAVKLGSRSALAHAFYSEALADSGDVDSAQKEIDAAAVLASGAYEKSEVEREKANLALDQGDKAGQLSHLLQAQKIQPGWAERIRELAEYYFASGQLDEAAAQFKKATDMAPGDAGLRVTLGSAALFHQDVAVAQEAYAAANTLKPHDPNIESTLAITSFATTRDTAATERLLRQAVAESPQSVDLAELLDGFLRYIKRDTAAADLVVVGKPPPEPIRPDSHFPVDIKSLRQATSQQALNALNVDRAKAHLAPVKLDDRITEGSLSHAYWWLFNLSLPEVKGLGIHKEVSGSPGFTGYSMRERATTFGYPPGSMAEDITHRGDPAGAIQDWVDSVYHRFPLMRPDLETIGFGAASGGGLPIDVMDLGFRSELGDPAQQVAFPADGQVNVPPAFVGNELPDPVPPGGKYPVGYPITVNYNPYVDVQVRDWSLTDAAGTPVDAYTLPPSRDAENVYTILPKQPLKRGMTYRVHIAATIQGAPVNQDWSFTTEGAGQSAPPVQQA